MTDGRRRKLVVLALNAVTLTNPGVGLLAPQPHLLLTVVDIIAGKFSSKWKLECEMGYIRKTFKRKVAHRCARRRPQGGQLQRIEPQWPDCTDTRLARLGRTELIQLSDTTAWDAAHQWCTANCIGTWPDRTRYDQTGYLEGNSPDCRTHDS